MAGTYSLSKSTIFGNMRIKIYNVTNFTNSETLTVDGFKNVHMAIPVISTADKAIGLSISGNVITVASGADTYDGQLLVIGN